MSQLFYHLPKPKRGLIGHRGASGLAPENTLLSFKKAADLGLNWVEFDIQQCASGEWIVFHDETLERTTNGHGLVMDTPFEVIQNLEAGAWFHPQYKGARIPLLSETLIYLRELKIHPNIEIKTFHHDKLQQMQNFIKHLNTYWPSTFPPPLVSSFDIEILDILRQLTKTIPLGLNIDTLSQQNILETKAHHFNSLHCQHQKITTIDLAFAHKAGLPILTYTVNQPEEIKMLLKSGITAIFSDLTNDNF